MNFLTSMFLGLVQGISEFLPISSSGHLSLMQHILHIKSVAETDILFEVLLHFGTLLAVFAIYYKDIIQMITDFFNALSSIFSTKKNKQQWNSDGNRMIFLLVIATLPLVIVIPAKDFVGNLYNNTLFVGCALIATACILYFSDRMKKGRKTLRNASIWDALIIGLFQCLAVVPGLSRAGSTISAGLIRGFDRKFAVRFSFLLSIPAILGANILEVSSAIQAGFDTTLIPIYLTGMVVAAVSGFFSIKLVNLLAQKDKFGIFAYYCFAVGFLTVILSIING